MSENKHPENQGADKVARYATEQQEAAVDALQQRSKQKAPQLTKEDVLRISSLPIRKMRVGNITQDVICDEITGYIYYPNPNATGPYNRLLPKRTPYVPEKDKKSSPPPEPNDEDDAENEDETEKKESKPMSRLPQVMNRALASKKSKEKKDKSKKGKKGSSGGLKKKIVAIGVVAALAAVIVCATPVIKDMLGSLESPGTEDPQKPTLPAQEPSNNSSIVQVVNDLIPGDIIESDDLKEAVISTDTYNQITLQGINLYQWSRYDALVGMYAQTYLPAGQYVSFTSVGATYQPPITLWTPDIYIDLLLTDEQQATADFIPGEKVNVVIRKQVTQESPITQDQQTVGDGGTATTIVQTTTIEEYSLPSTTICDVFTGESATNSLFQTLHELATVPAGEQVGYVNKSMKEEKFADKFHQKVLRVFVNKADMEKIGVVNNLDKVTINIEKTGDYSKDTDERAAFVASAQATMKNVQAAKQAILDSQNENAEGGQ